MPPMEQDDETFALFVDQQRSSNQRVCFGVEPTINDPVGVLSFFNFYLN